jgi:glycine/D-amino acid oxidase-like deaminating enzyme
VRRGEVIDCAVVGAGPAGLAASLALAGCGIDHVVLERDRVAATWRDQRWDSFRVNTAGWMNAILGGPGRHAYATGREVIQRLGQLAAGGPVRESVRVTRLAPAGDGWAMATDDGQVRARTVVVATGDQNLPRVLPLARRLPDRVAQLHAADYRNPGRLPPGGVLVVGSAQSGFMDQRPGDLPDPSVMGHPMPIIAPGRGLSLPALARGRRHPDRAPAGGGRRAGGLRRQPGRECRRRGRVRGQGEGDGGRDHPPPRPGRARRRA